LDNIEESICGAEEFIEHYYPEHRGKRYVCSSWLLSPSLDGLLPPGSHILAFKNLFEIESWDKGDNDFLEWVYGRNDILPHEMKEGTSLQRSMKRHLLKGGVVGVATGILKNPR